jgi:hypothetical protein
MFFFFLIRVASVFEIHDFKAALTGGFVLSFLCV